MYDVSIEIAKLKMPYYENGSDGNVCLVTLSGKVCVVSRKKWK